ncbi:TrkH family potassium uptake protein [Corynebacterium choanae]|uniref:Ktr system potassium uptake protein B n=1 Tax=Corynebacterium choanae TaxID=1862358 RepID=A0A3G6J8M3_9CORY|nr:potassium transporter TrkG [Corynebacterium choanae]AZA12800.1 Ktr system potassium uptake protein B [Corynebacterium choanae]
MAQKAAVVLRRWQRNHSGGAQAKPAQLVAFSFLSLIVLGTIVLLLPIARPAGAGSADLVTALFTATSATCLTGLIVVDTATYWSHFGQFVILMLIQLGGLGIIMLSTLVSWIIAGRIGVKSRLNTAAEGRGGVHLGEVKTLLIATLSFTFAIETLVAGLLTWRFHFGYGYSWAAATWEGIFHSISAFNNAGFSLRTDNLVPYVFDIGMLLPISIAIVIGGLGYPVLLELSLRARRRSQRVRHLPQLSLTARFTLIGTVLLLVVGFVGFATMEWNGAFAGQPVSGKLLSAAFQSITTRTAGFNTVDFGAMHPTSLMLTDALMITGGGSGGTAGGIKITTLAVLVAVVIAEIRSDEQVMVFGRRIQNRVVRQAMAVATMAVVLVTSAIGALMLLVPYIPTSQLAFEAISAIATVGLSTGITAVLPTSAKLVITLLMYAGRIGPITLVAALAARHHTRLYSYPDERPLIG